VKRTVFTPFAIRVFEVLLRRFSIGGSRVKVILTQDIPDLGEAGTVKTVTNGYARNYLFRNGLAVKASKGALREFEQRKKADARREEKMTARAAALAEELQGVTLTFEAKAGETGHLYGSITPAAIAEALSREVGEEFDRRKHIDSEPLREVGEHMVSVRLSSSVTAEVRVVVKPEGGELAAPAAKEAEESTGEEQTAS
jgi:large subunit ribosomal protein L9